jgi:segregation and condensation protein B
LDPRLGRKTAEPDPCARDLQAARLEAVLFLAREPLGTRKLAGLAHLADGTEARTLIRRLNRFYDETGTAFAAQELAGGFQLMSRPKFAVWLRRLYRWGVEFRLSGPALETLAVVAYRQPVMRAEIEAIRGVDCGEVLRQLMDRNLVRTTGRAAELGRPYLYATTKRFLQVFGLRHLEDLPRAEMMRNLTTVTPQPSEQTDASTSGEERNS